MPPAPDDDADPEQELDRLRTAFPQFLIGREFIGGRPRYVARRLTLGTRPHTVITADPAELRAALPESPAPGRRRERPPGAG